MHSHTFFSLSQLAKKSCKIPTTTITPSPVTRGRYRLSNTGHKHKCDGHTWTKGREIWGHGRERRNHQNRNCGSTSRCTTTMFTFLQRAQWGYPSGFERRCHGQQKKKKKKEGRGEGETKFHLAHLETAEGSFRQNAGLREKCTQGCRQFDCQRKLAKWGVFQFWGNDYSEKKKKKKTAQCIKAQLHNTRSEL